MRLIFGDEVIFEWREQTQTAVFGDSEFRVKRTDWLRHFSGTLDQLPLHWDQEIPVRACWFEHISAYLAPERIHLLYYMPYISLCDYLGTDRRISGILVSDLFKQCCL